MTANLYNNFFERNPKDIKSYLIYFNNIKKKLNSNIFKRIYINLHSYFTPNDYDNFVIYSFFLIREWINNNEIYTENYIDNLERNIKKLHLQNLLNTREKEYIHHFKSVIFNKKRNLKDLIVDFPLEFDVRTNKDEKNYFHFEKASLYDGNDKRILDSFFSGQIYLSTKRIVFTTTFYIISLYYENINSYKITDEYFEFSYFDKNYKIKTFDNYVFYVSFERTKNIIKLKHDEY
ncbi:MAG: hypothetical protein RSE95_01500 [Malacoplasma sp.]